MNPLRNALRFIVWPMSYMTYRYLRGTCHEYLSIPAVLYPNKPECPLDGPERVKPLLAIPDLKLNFFDDLLSEQMPKAVNTQATSTAETHTKRNSKKLGKQYNHAPKLLAVTPSPVSNSVYAGIHDLPVELLLEIMLFAKEPAFPMTSRHLRRVFCSALVSYKVEYILESTSRSVVDSPKSFQRMIERWLSYPICDLSVLQALERQYKCDPSWTPCFPGHIRLPKHLFRNLQPSRSDNDPGEHVLPLLEYLFTERFIRVSIRNPSDPGQQAEALSLTDEQRALPLPDPNSRHGYPLIKSVHARSLSLTQFLLDKGANPWEGTGMAIKIAVSQNCLKLVKQLLSCGPIGQTPRPPLEKELLDTAVRYKAGEIADYLVKERGYIPDIKTVQLMMRKSR